jgi:uncharacterized protein (DUF2141 family)
MASRDTVHTLFVALVAFALSSTAAADEETSSLPAGLTVDVSNIQNDKGQIGCSLYSKEEGFPSKPEKADSMIFVKSKAGKATCVFKGLKPGKYAVSVMHDEDKNGELKTSMVGRPKEWWGVSNNVPPERFGPPKYPAALFLYAGDPKTIKVKLRL